MDELLDIRTAALVTGLVSVMLALCMVHVYFTRKTYPGFRLWTLGYVCLGAGMLLLSLRHIAPDWVSIVVANTVLICQYSLLCQGTARFYDAPRRTWLNLAVPLAVLLTFTYYSNVVSGLTQRIIIVSLGAGVLCWRAAWLGLRAGTGRPRSANWLLVCTLVIYGALVFARSAFTISLGVSSQNFMVQGWIHGLSMIMGGLAGTAIMVALIGMNSQRLEEDLTRAAREAKTLKGFLPICANCKRIRDDDGYWNNLESYLALHSEAELQEGICPDCLAELNPADNRQETPSVLVW